MRMMYASNSGATRRFNVGGLVVAAVGFGLTRYTVLDTLDPGASLVAFLVGEAPVFVAGFALTAFGVGLTLSSRNATAVNVVAKWCLLGTAGMGGVVALTYVAMPPASVMTTQSPLVANALVGGAVGGTITGVRSARLRQHRADEARQADRLTVLNRLLRHEVLNKVNVIDGYARVGGERTDGGQTLDAWSVVQQHADAIDDAIAEVGVLTESTAPRLTDLSAPLRDAVESVRAAHPSATIEADDAPSIEVRGSPHLDVLFEHLVENAVVHSDRADPRVEIDIETDRHAVRITVTDDGPGLPPSQQRLVRGPVTPEEDDPTSGFGLAIARFILDDVDGDLTVETPVADGRGTAVTVRLHRADAPDERFGVAPTRLWHGTLAGLVAGGIMGLVTQFVSGRMAVIGALYGVDNVAVGWVSHQYHSVFFALLFVAATASWVVDDDWRHLTALGAGYGVILWLLAAGVVMPLWLRLVGIPAPLPNLGLASLANHLLWGVVFGGGYAWLVGRK
jgi:signal transduction histidine kinase